MLQDILIKPEHSFQMPDLIGADLLIVEGAGHAVAQQAIEAVNEALRSHFEKPAKNPSPAITRAKTTYLYYTTYNS